MPERVISLADHQHSSGDSGPQRIIEHLALLPGHRGQQPMPNTGAAHRSHPEHPLTLCGQPGHRAKQQIPRRTRQVRCERAVRIQQNLGEQRVPAAALIGRGGDRRIRRAAQDCLQLRGHLVAGKTVQVQAGHPVHPAQLGQQPPHRPGLAQLIRAERHYQQHGRLLQVTDQERQQLTGRPVGPVQILDHQHQRLPCRNLLQQDKQQAEQPAPRHLRITPRRRQSQLRYQAGQLARTAARQQPRHFAGPQLTDQRPQRRRERRERQARRAQVHASPSQHQRPVPHPRGELRHQPRLAAAGLRTQQHHPRRPASRLIERPRQRLKLGLPAHQDRAHPAAIHNPRMPPADARSAAGGPRPSSKPAICGSEPSADHRLGAGHVSPRQPSADRHA